MPGQGRAPTTNEDQQQSRPSDRSPGQERSGNPQLDLQAAPGGGNAAALASCNSWEDTGNLRGNPPVRDRCNPPNMGIVEDEAVYNQRRAAATQTLATQKQRAESCLDGDGEVTDHRYWFAKVYSFVTEGELSTMAAREYYYPSYVAESVRYFDQLYVDNANAWDDGGQVEAHWQQAFQNAADSSDITVQDVLGDGGGSVAGGALAGASGLGALGTLGGAILGYLAGDAISEVYTAVDNLVISMQAHIRYDLPRAEAWVFNQHYAGMDNAQIQDFQADFQSMAPVFDRAGERMNEVIADKTGVPVTLMPRVLQDLSMDWYFDADMVTERADTWERAEQLVEGGNAGTGSYTDAGGTLVGDVTSGDNMSMFDDLPEELQPTMESSAEGYDDDQVRETAAEEGADLASRTPSDRIRMLRALIDGATLDEDEITILGILRASLAAGDVVTVIDGASPWELASNTHGPQWERMRSFFRAHYYPRTAQGTAFTLITRCLDGYTTDWEEQMVADILLDRSDGRTIITELGDHYEGGGFTEGLNKLEWQLTGISQARVEARYGTSGTWW